jgi:hypothetical protein
VAASHPWAGLGHEINENFVVMQRYIYGVIKGRGRFKAFSDTSPQEKKIFLDFFRLITPLYIYHHVICLYLVKILLFIIDLQYLVTQSHRVPSVGLAMPVTVTVT